MLRFFTFSRLARNPNLYFEIGSNQLRGLDPITSNAFSCVCTTPILHITPRQRQPVSILRDFRHTIFEEKIYRFPNRHKIPETGATVGSSFGTEPNPAKIPSGWIRERYLIYL